MVSSPSDDGSWSHPRLGTFARDTYEWTQVYKLDGFEAYSYRPPYVKTNLDKVHLSFDIDDESPGPPTSEAAEIMARILGNAALLAGKIHRAVWDDFMGKGPGSGIWWHGDLEQVMDVYDEFEDTLPALKSADDVPAWLGLSTIRVGRSWQLDGDFLGELIFHAAFEEEHGLGILTDGLEILGLGYSGDASLFKS